LRFYPLLIVIDKLEKNNKCIDHIVVPAFRKRHHFMAQLGMPWRFSGQEEWTCNGFAPVT